MNPNHQVTWLKPRPLLTIAAVHHTGRTCYSETTYEVTCEHELLSSDFERLDECRLLGVGQSYTVLKHEAFTEMAPAVVVDKRTGAVLPDVIPVNAYTATPITETYAYEYHRYTVRRVCDSGD